MCFVGGRAEGQAAVRIDVPLTGLIARAPNPCRYRTTRGPIRAAPGLATKSDTIWLAIYTDTLFKTEAKLPVPLRLSLSGLAPHDLTPGDSEYPWPVPTGALDDATVGLFPANDATALCSRVPLPTPVDASADILQSHIDIAASGEIANALNSGSASAAATGSLGVHIVSVEDPGSDTTHFAGWWRAVWWPVHKLVQQAAGGRAAGATAWMQWRGPTVDVEDLQAFISVAGSRDSLTGKAGGPFAQAVLSPATASNALASSVQLAYSPMHQYGLRHQQLGLIARFVANQSLWHPDASASTISKQAVLMALDVRARWLAINHLSPDGNNFSMALEGGYLQRNILSDAARDPMLLQEALNTTRTRFTGYTTSISITLRNVTGFADLSCLSCNVLGLRNRHDDMLDIQQLEGLQPIVGFKFEAPFFSIRGK